MSQGSGIERSQLEIHAFVPLNGTNEHVHLYGLANDFPGCRERAVAIMTGTVFGRMMSVSEVKRINDDTTLYYTKPVLQLPKDVLTGDTITFSPSRSHPESTLYNWFTLRAGSDLSS